MKTKRHSKPKIVFLVLILAFLFHSCILVNDYLQFANGVANDINKKEKLAKENFYKSSFTGKVVSTSKKGRSFISLKLDSNSTIFFPPHLNTYYSLRYSNDRCSKYDLDLFLSNIVISEFKEDMFISKTKDSFYIYFEGDSLSVER